MLFTLAGDLIVRLCKKLIEKIGIYGTILSLVLFQGVFTFAFQTNSHRFWILYINPFVRLLEFGIGIVVGIAYSCQRNELIACNKNCEPIDKLVSNRGGYRKKILVQGVICITLCALGITVSALTINTNYDAWSLSICFMPASAMLVYFFSYIGETKLIGEKNLAVQFGNISFEVFLLHQIICRYICSILKRIGKFELATENLLVGLMVTLVGLAISVGIAVIWHKLFAYKKSKGEMKM